MITATTDEKKLPNGNSFFIPVVSLDVSKSIEVTDDDQNMFADFLAWLDNYNQYILNLWQEKANSRMEDDDVDVVDTLVDIEVEDVGC